MSNQEKLEVYLAPPTEEAETIVETNAEQSTTEAEEESSETSLKRRNKRRHPDPIERMRQRVFQADQTAQKAYLENDTLRKRLHEANEKMRTQAEEKAAYEVRELKQRVGISKVGLAQAMEDQDYERQAEFQDVLSKANAQLFDIQKSEREFSADSDSFNSFQQEYAPIQQQQEPIREPVPDHIADFLEENTWLDESSPDYDADLHALADQVADRMNKQLVLTGRRSEIGSPSYMKVLGRNIREACGVEEEDGEDASPTHRTSTQGLVLGSTVAGVPRNNSSYSGQRNQSSSNGGRITLSADEREFALTIPLLHFNGIPYSDEEKILSFARGKAKRNSQRA